LVASWIAERRPASSWRRERGGAKVGARRELTCSDQDKELGTVTNQRIPLWVKLAYTGFVGVVVPYYWVSYTPWNFLYFCDIALLATCLGMWLESPLIISMQAVGITLPQMLWVVDYLAELLFGVHVTGVAHYMFDSRIPVFVRGLSSFHGWLPVVLLWLLSRVGYDRRAARAQLAVVVAVLLVSYYLAPAPPIPAAHPSWAVNINYVYGLDDMHAQTTMPALAWLTMLGGIGSAMVVLTHYLFARIYRKPGPVAEGDGPSMMGRRPGGMPATT
jgi:hypothetical protein